MRYQKLLDKNGSPILAEDGKPIWVLAEDVGNTQSYWRTTVTVLNKKIDTEEKKVKWYATVLRNCFWGTKIDAGARGGGFQAYSAEDRTTHEKPTVIVRIPYQRKYQTPREWNEYPNGFTIKPDDILFRGLVSEPFANGKNVNEVLNSYGLDAMVVKVVKDNINTSDFVKHIHAEGY